MMKMKMIDDAFELAKTAYGAAGHAEAKDQLQKKYPRVEWGEIVQVYLKACDLAEACYDFGNRCRDKKITEAQAVLEMQERFPGFSEITYKAALSHGYFISR